MKRFLIALLAGALVCSAVAANSPPPPLRVMPAEYKVTAEKEFADYDFYLVGEKVVAVKLDPKAPVELKGKAGESFAYQLVGVPKGADKVFDTEKAFHEALRKRGGIKGAVAALNQFKSPVAAPDSVKGGTVSWEFTVEKVDAEKGAITLTEVVQKKAPAPNAPNPAPNPAPRGGVLAAGTAAALAALCCGFWVVGRTRRKV